MSVRSELRAQVEEISGRRCEHPTFIAGRLPSVGRCPQAMVEMAHITSIGMGGRTSTDTISNVLAACQVHARSTDDHSSVEWNAVGWWAENVLKAEGNWSSWQMQAWLREYVRLSRRQEGWNVK